MEQHELMDKSGLPFDGSPEVNQQLIIGTEIQEMQMKMGDIAANLYDGGWRAKDREQMIGYYTLTEDEADAICELLEEYEIADREE